MNSDFENCTLIQNNTFDAPTTTTTEAPTTTTTEAPTTTTIAAPVTTDTGSGSGFGSIMTTCDPPFQLYGSGQCYYIEHATANYKNWADAEAECQTYGSNVHLAGMETAQVHIRGQHL